MEISVTADLSKIGAFAKTLDKEAATVLRWRVRQAVKDVGEAVLKNARSNAAWSRTIPGATTLKTSFGVRSAGVTMRTDPRRAPWAYYYERGSKGSGGRYIRHPVYGSDRPGAGGRNAFGVRTRYDEKRTWRNIPTRPFFYRSVKEHGGDLEIRLKQELDAALTELGFHI